MTTVTSGGFEGESQMTALLSYRESWALSVTGNSFISRILLAHIRVEHPCVQHTRIQHTRVQCCILLAHATYNCYIRHSFGTAL